MENGNQPKPTAENRPAEAEAPTTDAPLPVQPPARGLSEDWTAALVGIAVLILGLLVSLTTRPTAMQTPTKQSSREASQASSTEQVDEKVEKVSWTSPLKAWIGKPGEWKSSPLHAFREKGDLDDATRPFSFKPIVGAFVMVALVASLAFLVRGLSPTSFLAAFPGLFLLAVFAYVLAGQTVIKNYNLEYALWALLAGLIISNTIGTPNWLKPAVCGELYIKIGLVLLGAEVLFGRLVALGVPGVFVSWVVTPVVLISTYVFGQRVLKIQSKSLNMVVSADMSVCGVSAAIATSAACRAKKEELSLAIGLSLSFTVVMMVVMPKVIEYMELDPVVGGAWIGGTIDATGAVAAAASSEALGSIGTETAITVKMIQNILIGVIAFGVAVYWTRWVETETPTSDDKQATRSKVGIGEIWRRFPKFVLGFVAASLACSLLFASSEFGELWVSSVTGGFSKSLRGWMFCLAFVCIGLDTNFRQLAPYFRSGKPVILYLCGQALNILLTFLMAYLMFGILFKQ